MIKTKNVPELRFPEFEGEWVEKRLGDLCNTFSGGTPDTTNKNYWNGDIPFIKSGEINNKITSQKISELGLKNSSAKLVKKGDLLLALYGATSGEVAISKLKGAINQAVLCIRCKKVKEIFLYHLLFYNKLKIISKYTQGGQPNLSAKIIKSIKIHIPPTLAEQQKIADFLSLIDEKIQLQSQKIEKLENYKKGLMQKLLTGELRFPEFKDEWVEKRLGEILDYEQPTKYLVRDTEYKKSGIPVLTAGKTFILGYTDEKEGIYRNLPVIIFDDFTTESKFVNFPFKIKSSAIKILKPKNSQVNLKLIFEAIQLIKYPLGGHKRYWINEFSKIKIYIPPTLEEQQKIASFLSAIDGKIELNKKKLEKLKEYKKALLQKMFV